jgi:hypothetical protein
MDPGNESDKDSVIPNKDSSPSKETGVKPEGSKEEQKTLDEQKRERQASGFNESRQSIDEQQ